MLHAFNNYQNFCVIQDFDFIYMWYIVIMRKHSFRQSVPTQAMRYRVKLNKIKICIIIVKKILF